MRSTRILGTAALALLAVLTIGAPSSAAQELRGTHGGNAYGTWANSTSGEIANQLGRSAFQPCPCNGTNGEVRSTSADHVASGKNARANRIDNSAQADKTASSAYTLLTSRADGTSLLDGRITANLVKAVARTDATASHMHSGGKQSRFGGLSILGSPLNDVAPNTRRQIPGFGYVVLREIQKSGDRVHRSGVAVNMIHLFITKQNSMHIPVGSEIVIGHAQSSFTRKATSALFGGFAFGTAGQSSSDQAKNRMGRSAAIYMGCRGTGGVTNSNEIDQASAGTALHAGSAVSTVRGATDGDLSTAVAKSTIENVSLLGGMVTADEVKGVSRSTWDSVANQASTDFDGSHITGLTVNGVPISRDIEPNTRVNLPGVGYLLLNHQVASSSADGAQGRIAMMELHLTVTDELNLPVGSTLLVGVAGSSVEPS
jgi:hypothetical protein